MAERADGRELIEVEGASHALAASQAELVADLILRAAQAVRADRWDFRSLGSSQCRPN